MANLRFFLVAFWGWVWPFVLVAQGPEPTPWLAPGQLFWKIRIPADGWYGLSADLLRQQGLSSAEIPRLQLFCAGVEQPMWVAPAGGVWFWGQKNRGTLDAPLYAEGPDSALNPDYSLYSDTAVYCLTLAPPGVTVARFLPGKGLEQPGPPVDWCWRNAAQIFYQSFSAPRYDAANLVGFSSYDPGEGFGSGFARLHRVTLRLHQPLAQGPPATLQLRLAANQSYVHHLRWQTRAPDHPERAALQWQETDTLLRYALGGYTRQIAAGALADNWEVQVQGQYDDRDQYTLASVKVRYPARWPSIIADTFHFALPPHAATLTLKRPQGTQPGTWLLLDQTENLAYPWLEDSLTLPPSDTTHQFLLVRLEAGHQLSELLPGAAPAVDLAGANYLILAPTHWLTIPSLRGPIDSLVAFRRSPMGGNYRVKVLDLQSLYTAFAFGQAGHPLAFRQLARWLAAQPQLPDYILLLGHGLDYTKSRRNPGRWDHLQLLPTFGSPGSDQLLLALPGRLVPIAPVGRLAVEDPQALEAYLGKLRAHATALNAPQSRSNQEWSKRVLQVAGGSTPEEQADFQQRLLRLGKLLSVGPFAARLTQVDKGALSASSAAATIVAAVDSGVLIKTFLGHGATTNTDFGLDDPQFFGTTRRYPLLFSLGCLTGNLFDQQISLSERFVLTPQRGAIAYIASSSYAYPDVLEAFAGAWYRQLSQPHYAGQGIGLLHHRALLDLEPFAAHSFAYRSLLEQINLHGDPALALGTSGRHHPVFAAGMTTNLPLQPSIATDSFDLQGAVDELGYIREDSLLLRGVHRDPSGQLHSFEQYVVQQGWRSQWTLRRPTLAMAGVHQIQLSLLPKDGGGAARPYDELAYAVTVVPGQLSALHPPAFALLPAAGPAQLVVTTASAEPIVFKVDTTPALSNPLLQEERQPQGGVGSLDLAGLLPSEGGTFFWMAQQGPNRTRVQSFTRSGCYHGWAQQHPWQWQQNALQGLAWSKDDRWHFAPRWSNVIGESVDLGSFQSAPTRILLNNHRIFRAPFWWGWGPSWCIAVFDPSTGQPWENPPGGRWGASNPERQAIPAFVFRSTNRAERAKALHFLREVIPHGHYVLLLNHREEGQNTLADQWAADTAELGTNILQYLRGQGARQVEEWVQRGGGPYAIAFRQGQGCLGEQLAIQPDAPCLVRFELPIPGMAGRTVSPWIGPARQWLRWVHVKGQVPTLPQRAHLTLVASSPEHTQQRVVYAGAWPRDSLDLRGVSADSFPWLRLELELTDSSFHRPWEPEQWQVHYQPTGVAALQLLPWPPDTLAPGRPLRLRLKLTNWGDGPLAEGIWRFSLRTPAGLGREQEGVAAALTPRDSVSWPIQLDTRQLQGTAQWFATVKPQAGLPQDLQWNQTLAGSLWLEPDRAPPLLEMHIDGQPALQGQKISANPVFQFRLSDPNASWNAQDTNLLSVQLHHEDGTSLQPRYQQDPQTQLRLTSGGALTLHWQPFLPQPGWYTLAVQARDVAGNWIGPGTYLLDLYLAEDEPEPSLLPYPNPCPGNCHFILRLPARALPAQWRVKIFSTLGQLVRELNPAELGPLRPGWQQSWGGWDGKDAAGRAVNNGSYWYQAWLEGPVGPSGALSWRCFTGKIILQR